MGRQIYPRFLETLRRGNFLEVIHSREQNSSMIGDWQAWHILLNLHNNSFGTHTGTKGIKFHPMITPISLRSGWLLNIHCLVRLKIDFFLLDNFLTRTNQFKQHIQGPEISKCLTLKTQHARFSKIIFYAWTSLSQQSIPNIFC